MSKNIWEGDYIERANNLQRYVSENFDRNAENVLDDCLKLRKTTRVLDAGCGTGRWSLFFAQKSKSVIGIDSARRAIETAKRKNRGRNKNLVFKVGNLTRIPAKNNSFDNKIYS